MPDVHDPPNLEGELEGLARLLWRQCLRPTWHLGSYGEWIYCFGGEIPPELEWAVPKAQVWGWLHEIGEYLVSVPRPDGMYKASFVREGHEVVACFFPVSAGLDVVKCACERHMLTGEWNQHQEEVPHA